MASMRSCAVSTLLPAGICDQKSSHAAAPVTRAAIIPNQIHHDGIGSKLLERRSVELVKWKPIQRSSRMPGRSSIPRPVGDHGCAVVAFDGYWDSTLDRTV